MVKNVVIILGAGEGKRMKNEIPKQFIKIAGKTIIEHTIEKFEKNNNISEIYVVINPKYRLMFEEILNKRQFKKIKKVLNGGKTRQESSRIGIYSLEDINDNDNILIHDAVRPFVDDKIIDGIVEKLNEYCAVDTAIPSTDTIIKVKDSIIIDIPKRSELYNGQTPQGFKYWAIKKAHELAERDNFTEVTDDCGLIFHYNICKIGVVKGDILNMKVTYQQDIYLADRVFQIKTYNNLLENFDKHAVIKKLNELKGKTVIIFGGTSGIGLEISNIAKKYGAKVIIASRRLGIDVSDYIRVNNFLKKINRADIVINTTGVLHRSPITSESIDKIIEQITVNLIGSFNVVKSALEHLNGLKSIILFSSSSYTRGRAFYSPYSASKAGIVNMVQALSEELETSGIRINAIVPSRTKTPMRIKNFGYEPDETLLDPRTVAIVTLLVALSDMNGQIIDVRKEHEEKIRNIINEIYSE